MKILILNGPNLHRLGVREPNIYGRQTYADLIAYLTAYGEEKGLELSFYQSNHEGDLVDALWRAYDEKVEGIVFNPAAYTHTSVAIADAVKGTGIPTVEVHLSDVSKRESFRQVSFVREAAVATVAGHGFDGYRMAIDILLEGENKT